jgi:hypothetical protein
MNLRIYMIVRLVLVSVCVCVLVSLSVLCVELWGEGEKRRNKSRQKH